ncbi:hypothetical protein [Robbsia andropogonis]|uniref:hypothetical protein n=1 Tax=Robbsia andropogonis TaxID=28092 RepID=UPI0012FC72DA|nr:hypothetical protein [Robbsia andropogonis]
MTPTEESLVLMEKLGGTFTKVMAAAYRAADATNRIKLLSAFGDLYGRYVLMSEQKTRA